MKGIFSFVLVLGIVLCLGGTAFAEEAAATTVSFLGPIGKGLTMSLAVFGGAFGLSKAAAGFFDAVARNPGASGSMNLSMLLSFILIESMVILAFVIAILM